jgi:hypothetical protein
MERLLRHGKTLKNFTYTNKEIADGIYSAMNSTQFLGVSVSNVNFNKNLYFLFKFKKIKMYIIIINPRELLHLVHKVTE